MFRKTLAVIVFAHNSSSHKIFLRELPLNADALIAALLRLDSSRRLSLLDGGAPFSQHNQNTARFLIAGFDPFEIVEVRGRNLRITDARGNVSHVRVETDAMTLLDERLDAYRQPSPLVADAKRFPLVIPGACIATLSYELTQRLDATRAMQTPEPSADDEPDAVFSFYNTLVIHDYARGTTYVTSGEDTSHAERAGSELLALAADIDEHTQAAHAAPATRATSNFTQAEYHAAVLRIQEHIRCGDVYQANLTQQINCPLAPGDAPENIYLRLRRAHPSAFGAFLRRAADTVVSISPERFLRVSHDGKSRRIEAAPIKGTRARGTDAHDDARLRRELEHSEKDRAENIMIVDLMRNDLGRVCAYGSIRVTEFCRVETHPTLFHLVSIVQGTLHDDVTAGDILHAAFPCGSITGAPKLRAMEILRDIEPCPRALSMGSIGYFAFDGTLDLNVAIRTMTIRDRTAHFNVGGGIVIDSRPEDEYAESLTKARALLTALCAELHP